MADHGAAQRPQIGLGAGDQLQAWAERRNVPISERER